MEVEFLKPDESDLKAFQEVQNKAFLADYLKYGGCPGYGRSIESFRESMHRNTQFKIVVDGIIVGRVSGHTEGDAGHIDALCVIPEYENRGIGQKAVAYIEKQFPKVNRWSLETPKDKLRHVAFYEKCGYMVTGEVRDENALLVILSKEDMEVQ